MNKSLWAPPTAAMTAEALGKEVTIGQCPCEATVSPSDLRWASTVGRRETSVVSDLSGLGCLLLHRNLAYPDDTRVSNINTKEKRIQCEKKSNMENTSIL